MWADADPRCLIWLANFFPSIMRKECLRGDATLFAQGPKMQLRGAETHSTHSPL